MNKIITIDSKNLKHIIAESIKKVINENDEYGEYYRRYNKLKGIAKNQNALDNQKKILTNNVYNSMADYQNPNYDGGLEATNKLMQHTFKQQSVNSYNTSNQNFENLKKYYNPQNFGAQVPQQYINTYNQWINLKSQYTKLCQIYINEYTRVNGRLGIVNNNKRLSMEFDKLNNFYNTKIIPIQQQVNKYQQFLNNWVKYFYNNSRS